MEVYPQSKVWPYLLAIILLIAFVIEGSNLQTSSPFNEFWKSGNRRDDVGDAKRPSIPEAAGAKSPIGKRSAGIAATLAAKHPANRQTGEAVTVVAQPIAESLPTTTTSSPAAAFRLHDHRDVPQPAVDEDEMADQPASVPSSLVEIPGEQDSFVVDASRIESSAIIETDTAPNPTSKMGRSKGQTTPKSAWPEPVSLLEQLSDLRETQFQRWAEAVAVSIQRLRTCSTLNDRAAAEFLAELQGLSDAASRAANRSSRYHALRRPAYAIERRLAVWHQVYKLATSGRQAPQPWLLGPPINSIRERLETSQNGENWDRYLQFDELYALSSHGSAASWSQRAEVAATTLVRMRAIRLNEHQRAFLRHAEFRKFSAELNRWVVAGIDLPDLLATIEAYESEPTSATAIGLARKYTLLQSAPTHSSLERAFAAHYRNANCRISVSSELINRMAPTIQRIATSIQRDVEGVRVRGQNNGWSRFHIRLIPDDQRIHLSLVAHGEVQSRTVSAKGPVRLFNTGESQFAAEKRLIIDAGGIHVTRADADARSGLSLNDIESDFDGVPLVGWMIRQLARQEHDEKYGLFRSHVQQGVSQYARQRLDDELDKRIQSAEQRLGQSVIDPLQRLQLDPTSVELRTTPERIVFRGRISSQGQLAANSPRPQALRDSLMSAQVHQSTVNNLIDQLQVGGQLRPVEDLLQEIASKLGREPAVREDLPANVLVRLNAQNPIRIEFNDNRALLTLNVAELKKRKRRWRDFIVRGYYRIDPQDDGLSMVRDESIQLISDELGFRDQIALRAIFTKALARNHTLRLVADELANNPGLRKLKVSQLVARDGWLGISISDEKRSRVASDGPAGRR